MNFELKEKYSIQDLVDIVGILRQPDGCPWDKEQTHESIRRNLIEETYEVAEAIDLKNPALLREELGDLLLQIILHTRMEEEAANFAFEDVCDGICKKLVYRHPHVFAGENIGGTQEVLQKWENLKNKEKGRLTAADKLDSVPKTLPSLMRSAKLQKRADEFGFRYKNAYAAFEDLSKEIAELEKVLDDVTAAEDELGDVLFSAVNVARFLKADPEELLLRSANKFANRVKATEKLAQANGQKLEEVSAEQLNEMWKSAKTDLP